MSGVETTKSVDCVSCDMPEPFDIHDHRHEMKQLKDTGKTGLYDNRKDVSCPVCSEIFDRLFLTKKRETTFPENDGARFCLLHQDDALYLFRH